MTTTRDTDWLFDWKMGDLIEFDTLRRTEMNTLGWTDEYRALRMGKKINAKGNLVKLNDKECKRKSELEWEMMRLQQHPEFTADQWKAESRRFSWPEFMNLNDLTAAVNKALANHPVAMRMIAKRDARRWAHSHPDYSLLAIPARTQTSQWNYCQRCGTPYPPERRCYTYCESCSEHVRKHDIAANKLNRRTAGDEVIYLPAPAVTHSITPNCANTWVTFSGTPSVEIVKRMKTFGLRYATKAKYAPDGGWWIKKDTATVEQIAAIITG
jgi:hypothetical protein